MAECFLCVETMKHPVQCLACAYTTCSACTKKYLLTRNSEAHCMNPECQVRWSVKFLIDQFGALWVNGTGGNSYRTHLKNVHLDRERAKLPETIARLPAYHEQQRLKKIAQDMSIEIETLSATLAARKRTLLTVTNEYRVFSERAPPKVVPMFISPCPTLNCRGLVERQSFSCRVCHAVLCRRCRAKKEPEEKHACNAADLETMKLIRLDTKPCPKCASPIHKISGCNQMW